MKFNLKNPLWKTDPKKAKKEFKREIRWILRNCLTLSSGDGKKAGWIKAFEEILGKNGY